MLQPWTRTDERWVGPPGTNENHTVEVYMDTLVSDSGGYDQYRVGAKWGLSRKSHTRRKVFRGETGLMDAERMFDDITMKVMYS